MMLRVLVAWLVRLALLCGVAAAWAAPAFDPTELVHQAMDEVLVETNNPFLRVIKQGSWISRDGFRNPFEIATGASDFDARLFVSVDDLPPERARSAWLGFKRRLQTRIDVLAKARGLSPQQIQLLRQSINLYPPSQMLKGVAENEQALAAFWRAGNYPNLLEVGNEGAEGLYTKATKFIRQGYEKGPRVRVSALEVDAAGDTLRLVERGSAELEHILEGKAVENLQGYLQATQYTLGEAQKALRAGNVEIAQKNLKRMTDYHANATRMAGAKPNTPLRAELDRLKTKLDELVEFAFGEAGDARELIKKTRALATADLARKANVELAAFEGLVGRNVVRGRAFHLGIAQAEGRWAAVRADIELASGRMIETQGEVAAASLTKHWIAGLFALWELSALPEAIRKEGAGPATARLAMTIGSLASMHVMLADIAARVYMAVGELLVDYISSLGYDAVVSRQDCSDLLAGLYTVPGREANVQDRSCETLADDRHLACRVYDHQGLRQALNAGRPFRAEQLPPLLGQLLGCHARAAARHYDDTESRHDTGVAQALMNRCMEPLVKTWLQSRQLVVSEIGAIRQSIAESPLNLVAQPARLVGQGVVRFTAMETMNLGAAEKDLGDRAACMGGIRAQTVFAHDHDWTVNGKPFARTWDRGNTELNLNAPGQYQVCVTQKVAWHLQGVPVTAQEEGLHGDVSRRGCIWVTVDEAPRAPTPLPPGANDPGRMPQPVQPVPPPAAQAPSCSYDYGNWGSCSRATKKQQRPLLRATPAGCVERSKPVLEQACDPGPSDDDKRNNYFNCMCRCSSGWAGHIGVYYDPEQKAVPECKSTGPCIGGLGAYGCSRRHSFNAAAECAKGCWEGAFGAGTYDPARAEKILKDENRKFKLPLKVTLKASKNPADFGDIVALTAEAADGAGNYSYRWSGCAQDAKDASAKVVNTRSCKACQASVSVTDGDGDSASAALTIGCNGVRVTLTQESPQGTRIPLGGKATFLAQAYAGDKPSADNLFFVWERNPDVIFGDPRNPVYETRGAGQSRNTATFNKPGRVPVWVSVLKEVEGRKATMGESQQIVFDVVQPRLVLSAQPAEPLVGQEVRVTVQEDPRIGDEAITFWWETAGNVSGAGPVPNVPNARAFSFKTTGEQAITVTVHAKARDGGQEMGVARLVVQPRRTGVTVTGPKLAGPPPMVWREGVGLVTLERQVAEHQRVEFAASVAPDPGQPLRYAWSTSPEGCTVSAPASRETAVTCSRAGQFAVAVVVRNAEGAVLGSAQGTLDVTVTAVEIARGQQKSEVTKKLEQARQLWGQGKIDEALALLDAARAADKDQAAPVVQQAVEGLKKLGNEALAKGDAATAVRRFEQGLRLAPNDAALQQGSQKAKAPRPASAPVR